MIFSILKKTFFLFLLCSFFESFGQQIKLSNQAQVSVLTCETGNESYSLFGHTAIRIKDVSSNLDLVYNYGAFDFETPNFVAKFAKGDLEYFMITHSFQDFINEYIYLERSVFEQELNISLPLKQKLFDNLNAVLGSNESKYTYKFIDKNCTTMVVDVLNKTLNAKIIYKEKDTSKTYRNILFPYFDSFFYEKLGTSLIFGTKVDQISNHIFLPLELHQNLKKTQFNEQLLCKRNRNLLEYKKHNISSWWNNMYSYLAVLLAFLLIKKQIVTRIYFLMIGIIGSLFVFVGFYSNHQELTNNYNLLLLNPTLLILLCFLFIKNKKWANYLINFNFLCLAIYLFVDNNKIHFWIVLPIVITSYILLQKIKSSLKKSI